jgi:erythromycin esterase
MDRRRRGGGQDLGRIARRALEPPEPGSIEAAFVDAGLGLALADLRRAPRTAAAGPDRLRMQSSYLHTPVLDSFDSVINVPNSTVADDIGF